MRSHAIHTSEVTASHSGWILVRDLLDRSGQRLLSKGSSMGGDILHRWADVEPGELHLIELEAGDLHENAAGLRIAEVVAGAGLRVAGPVTSRYDLVSEHTGLLRVDAALVRAINHIGDITVYTALDRQPVPPDTAVASIKITPLAIAAERIEAAERLCMEAGHAMMRLVPFQPKRVALAVAEPLSPERQAALHVAVERKLQWFGSSLTSLRVVAPDVRRIADAFSACLSEGNDVILAAGGNTIDPLDPVLQALPLVGASVIHCGAPMRGSMSWLATTGTVQILNLDSSRMYLGATVGDVYLPMLLTAEPVTSEDIMDIGYGGMPGNAIALRIAPLETPAGNGD